MSDRDSTTDGFERRGVLAALATGIGGAGLARGSLARLDAPETGFVVEQGDRCVPITPLSGDETVEAFYDYRTPYTSPSGAKYSSYGTTDLQRPETSICFLYDGPEGLSLVVVHDELDDGTSGGAVSFDLAFEHPDRGSWVVGDDDYDAASNYDTFDRTAEGWSVDWTWADGRSDGGAYRPLGESFAVTIAPAFNEAAELYGDHYEGEITDWEVLSGDRDSPERVSLALDEPLTIRPGTCGETTTATTTTRRETTEEETTAEEETTEEEEEDASEPITADLTVVPGKVNPRSHGRLPVVVRSTDAFDATALEPGSVELRPGKASPVKRIATDADADGYRDLKFHFWMDATGIDWETERLELTGKTANGRPVVATADLRLVPNGDDEDESEEGKEDEDDDERERREEAEGDDERDEGEDRGGDDEREGRDGDDAADSERDEEDHPRREGERRDDGRGREDDEGPGNGRGRGRGNGRGEERGNGRERGRGNGRGKGRGRGNGRGEDRGEGRDD
ncbi:MULTISPECIES: hypothetical protein [Halorussus]|uniref:hypothetical protein n=1 Tax=Halorussus TaxID=1070314 RepID=UPI000E20DF37|nr:MULTISPECIES: hypothetical protein [Halorussus]NHN57875.1 hypothetical protein [Halorussus sp. JP-T4]